MLVLNLTKLIMLPLQRIVVLCLSQHGIHISILMFLCFNLIPL